MDDVSSEGDQPTHRLSDWSTDRLAALGDEYGTPLNVIDLDRICDNFNRLSRACPEWTIHYATKANTDKTVLNTLAECGAGAEGASVYEARRSLNAGFDPSDVQYTAVNPPAQQLDEWVALSEKHPGITITVGAQDTVERLADRGYEGKVFVRVAPPTAVGQDEWHDMGARAKFGVPFGRVPTVVNDVLDAGMEFRGLHVHAGSNMRSASDLEAHRTVIQETSTLATELSVDVPAIDIGGGLGVPYTPDDAPLNIDDFVSITQEALEPYNGEVVVEPGRYLVADAGVIVSEVTTVKPMSETRVVGIDAGLMDLIRPAMFDSYHHIRTLTTDNRPILEQTVTGPTCSGAGVFCTNRAFSECVRGDKVAIGNTGAYGYVLSSYFHSRPRQPIVAIRGDKHALTTKRESLTDVTRPEVGAPTWGRFKR